VLEIDFAWIVLIALVVTVVFQIIGVFQKETVREQKLHVVFGVLHFILAAGTYAFLIEADEVVLRFAWLVCAVFSATALLWFGFLLRSRERGAVQTYFVFLAINIALAAGTYVFIIHPVHPIF